MRVQVGLCQRTLYGSQRMRGRDRKDERNLSQPNVQNIAPSYEETHFDAASKTGSLRLIVSPDGRDGSVRGHQDAAVHAAILNGSDEVKYELAAGRRAYVHVIRGSIVANGTMLAAGDALKVSDESLVTLSQGEAAEILLFDLP
jgi:quercetin 2,3-dioxygenase